MDLNNLPDKSATPSGVARENVGSSLDMLPDTNADTLRSLYRQLKTSPDEYAKARQLSRSTGLPMPTVQNNTAEAAVQAAEPDWASVEALSPKAAAAMVRNTELFQLAKDDTENLSWWEQGLQFGKRAGKYITSAPGGKGTLLGDVGAGAYRASAGAAGVFRAAAELPAPLLDPLVGRVLPENPLRRAAAGFMGLGAEAEATAKRLSPPDSSIVGGGVSSGVQSLTQNLLTLPMALLPGGQAAALAGMVSTTGGQAYSEAREKGLGTYNAAVFGASQGIIEYATEKTPLGMFVKDLKAGTPLLRTLVNNAIREVPGEQAATVLQDLNEWAVLNPDKTFGDYLADRPAAAAQTLIATVIGVGGNVAVMRGIQTVVDNANNVIRDGDKIQTAQMDFAKLTEMFERAAASKVRERSPETFGQFVQQVAEQTDGAVTEVYVDAQTLVDTLAQSGVDQGAFLGQVPSVGEQLQEAIATGGTVAIPIGEFTANIVGTGLETALLPHLRTAEDALSQFEAQQAADQAQTYMQTLTQQVMQEADDVAVVQASADVVKTKVLEQLTAGKRFTADVNEGYANLVRDFYTVMGARAGVTPEQMFARYPLTVRTEGMPLTQPTSPLQGVVGADTVNEVQAATQGYEQMGGNDPISPQQRAQAEDVLAPLVARANASKPAFDALMSRIAQGFGMSPMLAPVKGLKRAAEKLVLETGGDVNLIRDMLRATVVVPNVSDVQAAIEQVRANFEVVRIKDRFATPTESGYRDVLINVLTPDGMMAEIQINVPAMLAVKSEGHKLYEMARVLPVGDARRVRLEEMQVRLYAEAFDSAMSASNAAASTGVPNENTLAESGYGLGPAALNATQEPSGSLATGTPSTSNNLAPAGISNISLTSAPSIADAEVLNQAMQVRQGPVLFPRIIEGLKLKKKEIATTVMEFMTGMGGEMAFLTPFTGGIPETVAFLDERRKALGTSKLDIANEADRAQLAKLMAAEALAAISSAGNALTWYDDTIRQTLAMMAVKYPELNTDLDARNAFLLATAIASQGMNVEDNLQFAEQQYEAYRRDGRFPEVGKGESAGAMVSNFKLANRLQADMGPELFRRFLATPFTVSELGAAGFEIGGELVDEQVLGSSVFGPKIGFGFYSNLNGNFEPVTMDMWFMRTIGRLSGNLPSYDPAKFAKQIERFRSGLKESGSNGVFADQFDATLVGQAATDEDAAIQLARQVKSAHEKDFKNNRDAYDAGTRTKTKMVAAAETMIQSLDKPRDVPASGGERRLLRDVVQRMVDIVEQQYGERIPPAALQALIWYPEQELYKALGVKLRVTSQDYAGAARKILLKDGIDGNQLSAAAQSGTRHARQADGESVGTELRPDGQGANGTRPLEGTERQQFLDPRIQRTAENRERLKFRGQQVIFEVAPDPNDLALSSEWNRLPAQQRTEISERVARAVLPETLTALDIKGEIVLQTGSYLEDTNPSFSLKVAKGDALTAAKVMGHGLVQDSMVVLSAKPTEGTDETGLVQILIGDKSFEETEAIYKTLRALKIGDEQPIGGQTTSNGVMTVLNFSGVKTRELAAAIDEALGGAYAVEYGKAFTAFPSKEQYDYADQGTDTAGSGEQAGRWARDLRGRAQAALRSELDTARASAAGRAGDAAATAGASPRLGYHFSRTSRALLDGRLYGTGLKGAERQRLAASTDARLRDRVYFYIDEGQGVTPESGVGGYAHEVELPNLYNAEANAEGLWNGGDLNATESAILDAGYAGYYVPKRTGNQGIAVVIGNESHSLIARPTQAPGTTFAPQPAAAPQYRRGLLARELSALDLPAVQAVAPSANVRAGVLSVNESELEAARDVLARQGVELPGQLNQTLAEDMQGQGPFLEERAKAAGYDTVDEWAANDIGGFMKAAEDWREMNPAEALAQPKRGTFSPSQLRIDLLKDADLSTFLHETGHFFLEVMADLASQPGAPADVINDMNAVLKWFGVADAQTWSSYTLEQKRPYHEKFAESFEQYLFEGKAPNAELKPMFRRFREYMVSVYKSLKDFMARYNTELSDEVRGVFDRMIATEDQIKEAERVAGMLPDFDATNEAIEKLGARSLRDLKWVVNARSKMLKQLQKDVNEKRKAVKEEVTAEVRAMREYAVQRFLKFGELDGAKVEGGKLSLPVLKEMYGEGPAAPWRYLATNMVTKDADTGLHPNMVAELFGFTNGDEMTRAIIGAMPEDSTIDGLTDQRLLERYGDLVTEKGIERAANEAIHNEARARFVATELKAMQEAMNPRERTAAGGSVNVLLRAAKDFAENLVARRKVRDLKPGAHTAAEARAARRVTEAQSSGDTQAAVAAQRDKLLNHYAARMTTEALTEIDKKVDYLRKFDKDSVRSKLPPEYMAQIDKLLERVELRRGTSLRELDKRAKLAEWITAQQELGLDPNIPDYLLEDVQLVSYKDMTVEEFRGLVDAVRNIEHLGRLKDKLLTLQDKRAFAAVVTELEASIRENATSERPVRINAPTAVDRATDAVRGFFSSHRKLSSLIRQFDGMKDGGVFWTVFNRSMNAAGDKEAVMREKATKALSKIFEPIIKGQKLKTMEFIPAINMSLSLETRLAVALNWGNDANRQRVMDGDKWSSVQVEAILATLTADQLGFVQKAWDHINTYWPEISAKEERVSGIAPEKVQASSFTVTTADGTVVPMRGGYYPIKYDPDRSGKVEGQTAAELTKQMMLGQMTRATTRRGHTKSRADTVNRAVRKDLNVIFQHVDQVIHDLSWHEWLIDATRILRAGPIESAIRETAGNEVLREFKRALEDIAAGDVPAQSEFESAINHLRVGTTIAGMGWNLMTSLMQPLGLTQSIVRVGPKWVGKGMARWIGDAVRMENTAKEVYAKSEFMRLRGETMQREINEIRNKVQGEMAGPVKETYFYLIQKGQMIADLPTWLGQYEKSIAAGADEAGAIAQADQAVRDAQGGGQIMDLARVQRGGPLQKLFTNFYSYFSTTYNLTAERYNATSFKDPLQVGRFMVDMLMLYTVPAVLGFAMKEALKGGDDDEDKLIEKLIREQLNYMLGTMVGLRELGASINGFYGYEGPAGTRFFSEVAKFGKQAEQGEIDAPLLKRLNNAAGILFHYPAGQVNRTVEGFNAMYEGKTSNPMSLLVGVPKE